MYVSHNTPMCPAHAGRAHAKGNRATVGPTVRGGVLLAFILVATLLAGCGVNHLTDTQPRIVAQSASEIVATGQTVSLMVQTQGAPPFIYQWYRSGQAIRGATSSSLIVSTTEAGNLGAAFTAVASNPSGTVTSAPIVLTAAAAPPVVSAQPADQVASPGQSVTFSVIATGFGPLSYQWFRGGAPIPGATSNVYVTPPAASADNGASFYATVSNTAGTATSKPATLQVSPTPPVVGTQPASQSVVAGQPARFFASAQGTPPFLYQWFRSGAAIPGATSSSYTIPATATVDNGAQFTIVISNAAGAATSNSAILTVTAAPPAISAQPVDQAVTAGQPANFFVAASGTAPLAYQWFRGGIPIAGAVESTLILPATMTSDNNALFYATVTNSGGVAISAKALLRVEPIPPIASGLLGSSSAPPFGGRITLTPTFSGGTAVIGFSGSGSTEITASAVNGAPYDTPVITRPTRYTLTVSGTNGLFASTTFVVTPTSVSLSPISPANQTFVPGMQAFNATAIGGATNTIRWSATGGSFAGNVWTAPNAPGTYTITATSVDDPSVFLVTTAAVTLPVITGQPQSQSPCTGSPFTLSVAAKYARTYQWNLNGSPLAGATGAEYSVAHAGPANTGVYTATVTNAAGSLTSMTAKIDVGSTITSNPTNVSILATQRATFSVAAAGHAPFSYQWYLLSPNSSSGTAIFGATASTYTTPALEMGDNGSQYYASVSDRCDADPFTSNRASLTVAGGNASPTITLEPVNQSTAAGGTATFSADASGNPTYQWYVIPAGEVTGSAISGATASTYTATSTAAGNDQDGYYVIATNDYGSAASHRATLAVGNGILIQPSGQPTTAYVDGGSPATFTVHASSNLPITYQWSRAAPGSSSFTDIPGATSAAYTVSAPSAADSGAIFRVVAGNGSTTPVTSSSAAFFFGALPSIGDFCDSTWQTVTDALPSPPCGFQLTDAIPGQAGGVVWPALISTGNLRLSFTATLDDAYDPPADGFTLLLADPTLGATPGSTGNSGGHLGARGIPGLVLIFRVFRGPDEPAVPYIALGRSEDPLWGKPLFNVATNVPALAEPGHSITHAYTVWFVQGRVIVTEDGVQVFSGDADPPPAAYLFFTAGTGSFYERTVVSNLSVTETASSN